MLRQPRALVPFALERRVFNPYRAKVLATQPAHLLAYWPLDEISGTTAADASGSGRDATYSGATVNATTFLDGLPAPSFDGVNDYVNLYAAIQAVFNTSEGTAEGWAKTESSMWADSTTHRILTLQTDSNNFIRVLHANNSGQKLRFLYNAGGSGPNVNSTPSTTDWFHWAITWSKSANEIRAYFNGSLLGNGTGIGTWSGALGSTSTVIGAADTSGNNPWYDNIARVAIWDTPLGASDISGLATVP